MLFLERPTLSMDTLGYREIEQFLSTNSVCSWVFVNVERLAGSLWSNMMKINMFSKILRCYITLQRWILTRQNHFKDIGCKGDISLIIDVNTTDKIIKTFNHDGIMFIIPLIHSQTSY